LEEETKKSTWEKDEKIKELEQKIKSMGSEYSTFNERYEAKQKEADSLKKDL
jgi:hypothetical protein